MIINLCSYQTVAKRMFVPDIPPGITYWHKHMGYPRIIHRNDGGCITYQDCTGKMHTVPWAEWERYQADVQILCGYKKIDATEDSD